jgi:hypothetical protein
MNTLARSLEEVVGAVQAISLPALKEVPHQQADICRTTQVRERWYGTARSHRLPVDTFPRHPWGRTKEREQYVQQEAKHAIVSVLLALAHYSTGGL